MSDPSLFVVIEDLYDELCGVERRAENAKEIEQAVNDLFAEREAELKRLKQESVDALLSTAKLQSSKDYAAQREEVRTQIAEAMADAEVKDFKTLDGKKISLRARSGAVLLSEEEWDKLMSEPKSYLAAVYRDIETIIAAQQHQALNINASKLAKVLDDMEARGHTLKTVRPTLKAYIAISESKE